MNTIQYLGEQDFYIDKNNKGQPIICCKQKGISFVFFHADPNVCVYCENAKPEFVQLPRVISGCKFFMCNLSKCRNLFESSKQTLTPLVKVPLFILYANGKPFMHYEGEKQMKAFATFLQKAIQLLSSKQVFSSTDKDGGSGGDVTASDKTPFGIPYDFDYVSVSTLNTASNVTCEDGVCYLTTEETNASSKPASKPSTTASSIPQMYSQQPQQQQPYYPPPQQQQPQQQPAYYQPSVQQQQQQFMKQVPQYYQPNVQPYYPPPQPTPTLVTQPQQQYFMNTQQQPQYYPQQPQQPVYQNSSFYK